MSASSPTTTSSSEGRTAFAALIAGGVAIGFSPIFVRLSDLGPLASGFFRLALAVPVLAVMQMAWGRSETRSTPGRGDYLLLTLAGLLFAADIVCWHLSLFQTSVADATLIANTAPIMVAAGAALFFHERMKPLFLAGLGLAILGVVALALQKVGGAEPRNRMLGDALALGASATYASYLLLITRMRRRFGAPFLVLFTTTVSALAILPLALLWSPTMLPTALSGWAVVLGLALVAHAGGQGLITYALAHLPAAFASLASLVQAGVAAIAAWAIFGEDLTLLKIASAIAIFAGITMCRRAGTGS